MPKPKVPEDRIDLLHLDRSEGGCGCGGRCGCGGYDHQAEQATSKDAEESDD